MKRRSRKILVPLLSALLGGALAQRSQQAQTSQQTQTTQQSQNTPQAQIAELELGKTYPAGTVIRAGGLGYRLQVPAGLSATLDQAADGTGLELVLWQQGVQAQLNLNVRLTNQPGVGMEAALPKTVLYHMGQAERVGEIMNVGGTLIADYVIRERGVIVRRAVRVLGASRVILSALYPSAEEARVQNWGNQVLSALVMQDPRPALNAWRPRWAAMAGQSASVTGKDGALLLFAVCPGGGRYAVMDLFEGGGALGKLSLLPLDQTEAALFLTPEDGELQIYRLSGRVQGTDTTLWARLGQDAPTPMEFTGRSPLDLVPDLVQLCKLP